MQDRTSSDGKTYRWMDGMGWRLYNAPPQSLGVASEQQLGTGSLPQNSGIVPLPPGPSSQGLGTGFATGMIAPRGTVTPITLGGVSAASSSAGALGSGAITPSGVTAPLSPLGYGNGAASAFARPRGSRLVM